MMTCVFCQINDIVLENDLALAFYDKYPVNKGHLLIIPKRHVEQYFDLTDQERMSIDQLLFEGKKIIDKQYQPDGYNIGINCGEAAGQTIFHVHVHLIPRYFNDGLPNWPTKKYRKKKQENLQDLLALLNQISMSKA